AEQLRLRDLGDHRDQLALDELVRRDRLREHDALAGVLEGAVVARAGRADGSPGDAVASLREAGQRTAHRSGLWQPVLHPDATAIEEELRRDRGPQAELALHLAGREPGPPALHQEAVHALLAVLAQLGPHHPDVGDVAVGDPALRAVEHVLVTLAARRGAHA